MPMQPRATPPAISQQYSSTAYDHRILGIVLHYTAFNFEQSLTALAKQGAVASAHYLLDVGKHGEIYQLVPDEKRAWHAGVSHWRGLTGLNYHTIGIEIVNLGYAGVNADGTHQWLPYDPDQIERLITLLTFLVSKYQIQPYWIVGHSDIAPARKKDPGPLFPWRQLYENGLGAWVTDEEVSRHQQKLAQTAEQLSEPITAADDILKLQTLLKTIGYDIMPTGKLDVATEQCVQAFSMHFLGHESAKITKKTSLIASALAQKYFPNA